MTGREREKQNRRANSNYARRLLKKTVLDVRKLYCKHVFQISRFSRHSFRYVLLLLLCLPVSVPYHAYHFYLFGLSTMVYTQHSATKSIHIQHSTFKTSLLGRGSSVCDNVCVWVCYVCVSHGS